MNPAHIEIAIRKECAARRRKWGTVPLVLCLLPAVLASLLILATVVTRLAGVPFTAHFATLGFHLLDKVVRESAWVLNVWLQILLVFYLTRSLHGESGRDEALFWQSVGLDPSEIVAVRAVLSTVVLPLAVGILATVVAASLGLVDLAGLLVSGRPVLASAASLLVETPPLAFLSFAAFFLQALWLLPVYGYLLVVSCLARRGRGPGGHPLLLALLGWLGLTILGGLVAPLGRWLSLLSQDDPLEAALRFAPHEIHAPMLLFNVVLGLGLLILAAWFHARPER